MKQPLTPPARTVIQPDGRFIHPGHKRTVEPDSTSNYHGIQRRRTSLVLLLLLKFFN
jgi:hypothetical protein